MVAVRAHTCCCIGEGRQSVVAVARVFRRFKEVSRSRLKTWNQSNPRRERQVWPADANLSCVVFFFWTGVLCETPLGLHVERNKACASSASAGVGGPPSGCTVCVVARLLVGGVAFTVSIDEHCIFLYRTEQVLLIRRETKHNYTRRRKQACPTSGRHSLEKKHTQEKKKTDTP